jgi:hypothetical protein
MKGRTFKTFLFTTIYLPAPKVKAGIKIMARVPSFVGILKHHSLAVKYL